MTPPGARRFRAVPSLRHRRAGAPQREGPAGRRSSGRDAHPLASQLGHYRRCLEHPTGARPQVDGDEAFDWIGYRVDDIHGARVGVLSAVLVDRDSGHPLWLMLELRGHVFTAVPRAGVVAGNGHACLPYAKRAIAAAPRFARHGALTATFDDALRGAYGLPRLGWADLCWDRRAVTAPAVRNPEDPQTIIWAPGPRAAVSAPATAPRTPSAPPAPAAPTAAAAAAPRSAAAPAGALAQSAAAPQDAAEARDTAAEARDRAAEMRDRAAAAREQASYDQPLPGTAFSAGLGRRVATEGRRANDRLLLAAAARDRMLAEQDRLMAARDRAAAAAERGHAAIDLLTGVRRREAGLLELQREVDRAARTGTPLVVSFIDVDGLKQVNDLRGHLAGDALLARVAASLRSQLRSYDLILRFGGDEFVCGLPGVSRGGAEERFRAIAETLADTPDGGSLSVGFAELLPRDTPASLIARADAELLAGRRSAEESGARRPPADDPRGFR